MFIEHRSYKKRHELPIDTTHIYNINIFKLAIKNMYMRLFDYYLIIIIDFILICFVIDIINKL